MARHENPFGLFGLHETAGGLVMRTFQPGATSVELVDTASGKKAATLERLHEAGFFAARVTRRKQAFPYRLRVDWGGAAPVEG